MNVSKEDACAALRRFGIDLLDLCDELGVTSINIHADTEDGADFISAFAFTCEGSDEPVISTSWMVSEVKE